MPADMRADMPADMPADMKGDWNKRARENPRFYIASSVEDSEAAFERSGERDAGLLFDGLEHLLGPDCTAVDIGCGIGRVDRYIAPQVRRLIGLDVAGEMLQQAKERLHDRPNVEFLEGDGWTLQPLADASADLVFSCIVFQHMPRQVASSYFEDAHRILRAGGHFLFQLPEGIL